MLYASYLDEMEKLAAAPGLKAGLAGAAAAGLVAHAVQRPQERTDQLVRAVGGMSKSDLADRRRRRAFAALTAAGLVGVGAGAGYRPLARKASDAAGRFVADIAKPTMSRAEALAGRASKQIGSDIAESLAARGADAGRSFSAGLKEGLTPGSFLRRLREGLRGR